MSGRVRFTRLIERENDQGETVLSGWFGSAKVIGHRGGPTEDGNKTWIIYLAEPDDRALEARRSRNKPRAKREHAQP